MRVTKRRCAGGCSEGTRQRGWEASRSLQTVQQKARWAGSFGTTTWTLSVRKARSLAMAFRDSMKSNIPRCRVDSPAIRSEGSFTWWFVCHLLWLCCGIKHQAVQSLLRPQIESVNLTLQVPAVIRPFNYTARAPAKYVSSMDGTWSESRRSFQYTAALQVLISARPPSGGWVYQQRG